MSKHAFISLGSNVEPEKHLPLAVAALHGLGPVRAVSHVYQSPAVGSTDQPDFLNAAVLVVTSLSWVQVRGRLREMEAALGRVRSRDRFSSRTIDLDLCLYGDTVVATADAVIPHPQVTEEAYVAVPLAELAPAFRHPVTGETLASVALALGRHRRDRLIQRTDVVLLADPTA